MENAPSFVTHQPGEQDSDEDIAKLAAALGHPHRVAIIRFLMENPRCFCGDIVDELPVCQSTVSQHLKKLKEAGWISGEVDGPKTCYGLKPGVIGRFAGLLETLKKSGTEGTCC